MVTKKGRLRWFTHVERTDDADWTTLCDHVADVTRFRARKT